MKVITSSLPQERSWIYFMTKTTYQLCDTSNSENSTLSQKQIALVKKLESRLFQENVVIALKCKNDMERITCD